MWGARFQVETPVFNTASLLWGVDYSNANLEDELSIFDADEFDATGGLLRVAETRTFYPRFSIENLGLFGQLQWDVSEQWLLSGGLRYERFGIDVPDFTNQFLEPIEGGNRTLDDVVFNSGVVFKPRSEAQKKVSNPAQSYVLVGLESIKLLDADVMFVALDPGSENNFKRYRDNQIWQLLNVVKNNRIYTVDSGYWIVGNILCANAILDDISQYLLGAE